MNLKQLELIRMIALWLALGSLTACLGVNGNQPRITLEKDMIVGFGSGIFDLIEFDSAREARRSGREHLRVATYRVAATEGEDPLPDTVFARTLRKQGSGLSWERIARVGDEDSQVWVFAGMNTDAQRLESVCVFLHDSEDQIVDPETIDRGVVMLLGSLMLSGALVTGQVESR